MGLTCKSALYYCKTYPYCILSFSLAVLGCICLTTAVASPYWLVSKKDSGSDFVRVGLWNVCFKKYQHPSSPEFPHILDGCYSLHLHKNEVIRNWLQPVWFIIVQCLVTSATFLSALCICLLGYMFFQEELQIKIFVSAFVFVFEAISGFLAFLGASIFGVMTFERTWITHPKTNDVSWGFAFCILSAVLLCLTAGCLLMQTLKMRKKFLKDSRGAYHIPLSNRPYLR